MGIKMKKPIIIWIMTLILLSSFSFAYYPTETTRLTALYTENDNPISINANITIVAPSTVILINNVAMNEYSTGRFNYTYTFPNTIGGYKARVDFYNSTWDLQGTTEEILYVEYNYTEDINNISDIVQENNNILTNIWDWVQSTVFGVKTIETEIIGKVFIYNKILFKTTLNYYTTNCTIFINDYVYNMSIDGKLATYLYYINETGENTWGVTCNE